jgi:hypothetical protein
MPRGGKRPGAGRPRGSRAKKTQAIAIAAMAAGISPLELMLQVMRDESVDSMVRLDMAKAAAPYVHARLAATIVATADAETQVVVFKTIYADGLIGVGGPLIEGQALHGPYDADARAADVAELAALRAAGADQT